MQTSRLRTVVLLLTAVAFLGLTGASCHTTTTVVYSQPWYDVYGNYCGNGMPRPGCNFYANGMKIYDLEDPYYGPYNDISYAQWVYTDSYGFHRTYFGWAWLSPTGILYDDYGRALNNDEEQGSRDLIADVAAQEREVVVNVGRDFAKKHALAESSGIHIARTLNDWATLAKKQQRARTDEDVADFSRRLYGVSVEKAKSALAAAKNGDRSGIETVNSDIAAYWGTSPETSSTILKGWYKDQLTGLSL
jgi:hypothetical protein